MMNATKDMNRPSPAKPAGQGPGKIDRKLIDNVEVSLEAYLGPARMTVADLSALSENSVVRLESGLNRSVELRLNGISVGTGELVAVGDRFGVRLTELAK